MAYLFPYAGDDRKRSKVKLRSNALQEKDRVRQQRRRALLALEKLTETPAAQTAIRKGLQELVDAVYNPPPSSGLPPSYREILREVALLHRTPYKSILGQSRMARVTQARRHFMFRCMEEIEGASYTGVGRYVKRDHTTVIYAHKKGQTDPSSLEPLFDKPPPKARVRGKEIVLRFTDFEEEVIRLTQLGLTHEQIAERTGKTRKVITNNCYEIRQKAAKMGEAASARGIDDNFGRVWVQLKRVTGDE